MTQDRKNAEHLISLLQTFVRFPSEQTALQEQDPAIKAFIEECAAPVLRDMGLEIRYDGMGNLIAEVGPTDTGRSIMFVTYAMTHPANSMKDPFAATVIETPAGTAVRGRGVAEQKTALAAAVGAVERVLQQGKLGGRLIFTLVTAGETGRHDAVASVMQSLDHDPQCAVVCIGTNNKIAIGNKGRVDFDIIVKGKTSHSSAPWNGINSISGAQRIIAQLEGLDLGVPDHPAFGPATLTPTAIDSSPKATHTVPDAVRITFDRRLMPGEEPETAFQKIREAVSIEEPWKIEFTRGPVMYPNELALDGPFYSRLSAAFDRAGHGKNENFYCSFALDSGYFSRRGIESVMLGPGEVDQFHSNEEHVLVSDLAAMSDIYYELIGKCLSVDD
jgi:acetylornithine deacetylase